MDLRSLADPRTSPDAPGDAGNRPLEDARQSAPDAIGARVSLAFLAGWTLPFDAAALWTGFVLATIVPSFIAVVAAIVPRRPGITVRSYLGALGHDLRLALAQSALMVTFLAHQAWLMGVQSSEPWSGCSSPDGISSNGFRQPRQLSVRNSIFSASIAEWQVRSLSGPSGACRLGRGAGDLDLGGPVRGPLDRLARHRALGEPVSTLRGPSFDAGRPTRAPYG